MRKNISGLNNLKEKPLITLVYIQVTPTNTILTRQFFDCRNYCQDYMQIFNRYFQTIFFFETDVPLCFALIIYLKEMFAGRLSRICKNK